MYEKEFLDWFISSGLSALHIETAYKAWLEGRKSNERVQTLHQKD